MDYVIDFRPTLALPVAESNRTFPVMAFDLPPVTE